MKMSPVSETHTGHTLVSFPAPVHAVVIGHRGGIGAALVAALLADPAIAVVSGGSRQLAVMHHEKFRQQPVDITDETSLAAFADFVSAAGPPRIVLIASGFLHGNAQMPEKSWRALDKDKLMHDFAVNTIGPALAGKYLLPLLPRGGKSVFAALSARVSSLSDNRSGGWHGYRASKAALNMMLRNFALELAPRWPDAVCVGLHPGTVDTALSKPFQGNVAPEKLFTSQTCARHLLVVLDKLAATDSGRLFAWNGAEIPF